MQFLSIYTSHSILNVYDSHHEVILLSIFNLVARHIKKINNKKIFHSSRHTFLIYTEKSLPNRVVQIQNLASSEKMCATDVL